MTAAEKRTIALGLKQFELIKGAGSEESKQACAMTLLAWVKGRPWTDHPPCAHPIIASWVIGVNDAPDTTKAQQATLVRAGATGVLDTWWVPDRVLAWAWSTPKDKAPASRYEHVLYAIKRVAKWKASSKELPPVLSGADLSGAVLRDADLRDADLSGAVLRDAVLRDADLSRAVLSGADLSGAVLRDADLRDADLSRAVLSGADLSRAVGTPWGGMPSGWKLNESGLWVKA